MSIQPMNDAPDAVLANLHATRRRLLEEHGGVRGLAAFLRQEEKKSTRPIAATLGKPLVKLLSPGPAGGSASES